MSGSDKIIITPIDPAGPPIVCKMTETIPTPTLTGGWNSVPRATRRAFTEWAGADSVISLNCPVLLDGYADDRSIEPEINQIETLMFPTFIGPPPVCKVVGQFSQSQWKYVLNGIEYGDLERRNSDGARIRQFLTLTFLEYVAADTIISGLSPAKSVAATLAAPTTTPKGAISAPVANKGTATTGTTYIVKAGDTLIKIGNRFGVSWQSIATLNSIRDPNRISVGQHLRIK